MVEKLSHQGISVEPCLCKQQSSGCKTIDAMNDPCPLFIRFEACGKYRQGRWNTGALNRHRQKSGRFIEHNHGVVFVEDGNFAGEKRPAPVLSKRSLIPLSCAAASLWRTFLHW